MIKGRKIEAQNVNVVIPVKRILKDNESRGMRLQIIG
jgi:hypothetical protein